MNVLVVDDSAAMRKIIIAALGKTELRGARAVEAASGKEGLDKFFDMWLFTGEKPDFGCTVRFLLTLHVFQMSSSISKHWAAAGDSDAPWRRTTPMVRETSGCSRGMERIRG